MQIHKIQDKCYNSKQQRIEFLTIKRKETLVDLEIPLTQNVYSIVVIVFSNDNYSNRISLFIR